jgi:hypothetical protein
MKLRFLLAAIAAATVMTAHAAGDVYLQAGTQGAGVGYAQPLTSWLGLHADVNGFGLSHNFSGGSLNYSAHLHMFGGGTYADLFPFHSSGFRITAGALISDDYLSGSAIPNNGTYTINGTAYSAAGSTVNAKLRYPTVRPYLGIGYGHQPSAQRGFGLTADLGAAYGTPSVSLNASPQLVAAAGAANIAAEQQSLQSKANHYRFYPIVQIGLTYRF